MPIYEEKEKVNGQKRYYIRTYITNELGKKVQATRHNTEWIGNKGKLLAQEEEIRLKNNKKINIYDDINLNELYNSYIEELSNHSKKGTIKKHQDNIEKYILPYFENYKAKSLTNKSILEWKQYIENKNFSFNFKKGIFVSFSALLNHGHKYYNLENNVARDVGNFKRKKGITPKQMCIMSEEEFDTFINNEKNLLYSCFFTILFYTGMRRGELLGLKWENVNLKEKTLNIVTTYNPKLDVDDDENSTKTDDSNRKILVTSKVIECFNKLTKIVDTTLLSRPFKDVKLSTLKRKCDSNHKLINNLPFTIHDFRHSFVSMCIDKGISINIISSYIGHKNITTTLNTYAHLYPNSQEKLINTLEKQDQKQDQN